MKNNKLILIAIALVSYPGLVFAEFSLAGSSFGGMVDEVLSVVKVLIPLLTTAALVFFVWGLARVILNSGNATQVEAGRNYMIWAVIALFVMVSFIGIITFIQAQFGVSHKTVYSLNLPE